MGNRQIDLIALVRRTAAAGLFCTLLAAQVDEPWLAAAASATTTWTSWPAPSSSSANAELGTTSTTSSSDTEATLARYEKTEPHMGTTVRLVLYAASPTQASRAARAAFERIAALNDTLSDYKSTSELMRLSARAGQGPIAVSPDLFRVLDAAQSLANRSNGAFDVTSGRLTRLWRAARRLSELPSSDRITDARAHSGHQHLHLDATTQTATLDTTGITLDVGGIAKGYAADEALRAMAGEGVNRALVAIGGDIAVAAPPPGQDAWAVDIAPLEIPGAPHIGTLHLRDAAVSTAGDAEQWMTANGRRYSHILDPRTGWPMTGRSSTTVIAPRGLDADGLDTTAAILGPESMKLVEDTPGAAMFMVRAEPDGRISTHISSRWPAAPAAPAKLTSSSPAEH